MVAHFHYIMVGGMVMAYMGGLHYWWPEDHRADVSGILGKMAALIMFIGFNLTFFPQFVLGYLGMPRRYHAYPPEFQVFNVLSTAGASILGVGYLLPLIYLIWSLKYGRIAGPNPWRATGLEWQTASPPPKHNFEETPIVIGPPYQVQCGGRSGSRRSEPLNSRHGRLAGPAKPILFQNGKFDRNRPERTVRLAGGRGGAGNSGEGFPRIRPDLWNFRGDRR